MFSDVVPHRGSEKKSQNDDFLSDLELSWVGFNQTLLSKRKRAFFFCQKFKSGCQPLAHGMNFFFSKSFFLGGRPEGGAKPQKRNTKDTKSQKRKPTTKNSPQFVKIECLTSGTLCLYTPSTFWTENRPCPYLAIHPGCFFLPKNTPFYSIIYKNRKKN